MSKRRATEELYAPDSRKRQEASTDRAAEFTAHLQALNKQFAQWIQEQASSSVNHLWSAGAKDYVRHADKLLADFADIIQDGNSQGSPQPGGSLFGSTPAATPAASGRTAGLDADVTNGPIGGGRRSVSFAPTPNFSSAAETAAAAPGTFAAANTTDAGHTPAPASGLGFSFGATPAANTGGAAAKDFGSPAPIKWGSTPNASDGTPGSTPGFGSGGFNFGAVTTSSTPAANVSGSKPAVDAAVDAQPAPKAFSFGVSSSSTPAAGGSSAAAGPLTAPPAASPVPPSTGGFSFGITPPPSSSATASAAASSGTPASNFTFGVLPASGASGATGAAASSPPLFNFAATAGTSDAAPGMFKFPAPAAQTGEDAAGDGDAEEEAPAKYKPEITVDENTWSVYFNGKARLHVRRAKDGKTEWDPKGVGVLTVRQKKDGSDTNAYITFTNDGGKQLVSSRLQKHTEVHIVPEKPNKCRISLTVISYELPPAGQAGDSSAASTAKYSVEVCMITLGTNEKMQELHKVVNEHKPK